MECSGTNREGHVPVNDSYDGGDKAGSACGSRKICGSPPWQVLSVPFTRLERDYGGWRRRPWFEDISRRIERRIIFDGSIKTAAVEIACHNPTEKQVPMDSIASPTSEQMKIKSCRL